MRRASDRTGRVGMRSRVVAILVASVVGASTTARADDPPGGKDDRPTPRPSSDLKARLKAASSIGYCILGVLASAKGKEDTALADLDVAIQLNPTVPVADGDRAAIWIN